MWHLSKKLTYNSTPFITENDDDVNLVLAPKMAAYSSNFSMETLSFQSPNANRLLILDFALKLHKIIFLHHCWRFHVKREALEVSKFDENAEKKFCHSLDVEIYFNSSRETFVVMPFDTDSSVIVHFDWWKFHHIMQRVA